jgi:hypothetical protein
MSRDNIVYIRLGDDSVEYSEAAANDREDNTTSLWRKGAAKLEFSIENFQYFEGPRLLQQSTFIGDVEELRAEAYPVPSRLS